MTVDLLEPDETPSWFRYPTGFQAAVDGGLSDIGPWQVLGGEWLRVRHLGLQKRFPDRDLVPFARRLDCDDVAVWERGSLPTVCVIHDFAAPGWEAVATYDDFEAWRRSAEIEAVDFD